MRNTPPLGASSFLRVADIVLTFLGFSSAPT
jgi:hypothetical protein